MFDYPVTLTPDDGSVLVTFADVPEAITYGADEQEALIRPWTRWNQACRSMWMRVSPCPAQPCHAWAKQSVCLSARLLSGNPCPAEK